MAHTCYVLFTLSPVLYHYALWTTFYRTTVLILGHYALSVVNQSLKFWTKTATVIGKTGAVLQEVLCMAVHSMERRIQSEILRSPHVVRPQLQTYVTTLVSTDGPHTPMRESESQSRDASHDNQQVHADNPRSGRNAAVRDMPEIQSSFRLAETLLQSGMIPGTPSGEMAPLFHMLGRMMGGLEGLSGQDLRISTGLADVFNAMAQTSSQRDRALSIHSDSSTSVDEPEYDESETNDDEHDLEERPGEQESLQHVQQQQPLNEEYADEEENQYRNIEAVLWTEDVVPHNESTASDSDGFDHILFLNEESDTENVITSNDRPSQEQDRPSQEQEAFINE